MPCSCIRRPQCSAQNGPGEDRLRVSDIDMPGIDGFELLELIEAVRPDLPTILITGYPDRLERMPLLGVEPSPCLYKTIPGAGAAGGRRRIASFPPLTA